MKFTLTAFLILTAYLSFAQKINYLNANFIQVNLKEKATYYTETTQTGPSSGTVKTFLMNGQIVSEESFSNLKRNKRDGLTKNYYPNGKLKLEMSFKDGIFHGPLKTFYPNQRLKRAELYENGTFVAGKCFTPAGYDTAYYAFQIEPQFPGGLNGLHQYLIKNSRIPIVIIDEMLMKQGFNNFVVVKYVVTSEGNIEDVMIRQSLSNYYDREAMRLVENMPKWNPGLQDGEKSPLEHTLLIGFRY